MYRNDIPIATIDSPTTSYNDSNLEINSNYNYQIQACNDNGCSLFSNKISITTIPAIPVLRFDNYNMTGDILIVEISWNSVKTAIRYELAKDDAILITTDSDLRVMDYASLDSRYKVRACNEHNICSAYSEEVVINLGLTVMTKYGTGEEFFHLCPELTFISGVCKLREGTTDIYWQLVYNVEQLQDIVNNLDKNYLMMNDIDASATRVWNNGLGFDPIGSDFANRFRGRLFDGGSNNRINNLFIRSSTEK